MLLGSVSAFCLLTAKLDSLENSIQEILSTVGNPVYIATYKLVSSWNSVHTFKILLTKLYSAYSFSVLHLAG